MSQWQLGHHWWQWRLSYKQPVLPPLKTKQKSQKLSVLSAVSNRPSTLKWTGHQDGIPDIHWRRWRQASMSTANTKAVNLMNFPLLYSVIYCNIINDELPQDTVVASFCAATTVQQTVVIKATINYAVRVMVENRSRRWGGCQVGTPKTFRWVSWV